MVAAGSSTAERIAEPRIGPRLRRWAACAVGVAIVVAAVVAVWLWYLDRPVRAMRAAIAQQRWANALRRAFAYLESHPDDAETMRIVARALAGLGQWEKAEEYFTRAGDLPVEDLRVRADALIAARRTTDAARVLEQLHTQVPDDPEVLQRLAVLQFQRGLHDEAFRLTETLGKIAAQRARALCIQGIFHAGLKRSAEAVRCMETALQLNPAGDQLGQDPATLAAFLGAVFLDVGRHAEARRWLVRAAEQSPNADVYWSLGEAELGCGNAAAAERIWRAALQLQPDNHSVLLSLAKLALTRNQPLEALEWLAIAQETGKETFALEEALARAYARVGRAAEAGWHSGRAKELRQRAESEADEENLLARYPHVFQARLLLARRALQAGNVAEAKALIDELAQTFPTNANLREIQRMLESQ